MPSPMINGYNYCTAGTLMFDVLNRVDPFLVLMGQDVMTDARGHLGSRKTLINHKYEEPGILNKKNHHANP